MSKPKEPIKMRVNMAGFSGSAASIYAAYDPESDLLLIAKQEEYDGKAKEGFLKITNQPRDEVIDSIFTDDDVKSAIDAYFTMEGLRLLEFGGKVKHCNPAAKIEREGIDAGGVNYRLHPDMSNSQVAVMAACLYANRQRDIGTALGMMSMFTIG